MPIEINSINTNNNIIRAANNKSVAFKTNPTPQDDVDISTKKKGLSTNAKVGIGLGSLAIIGIGIYKRKAIKNLFEKLFNKDNKKPPEPPKTPPKPKETKPKAKTEETKATTPKRGETLPAIDFKSFDDAKVWFEKFGIKTEFRDISESDLSSLNKIAKDFAELDRLGVAASKPDLLIISDWTKIDELSTLPAIRKKDIDILRTHAGYWGYAGAGADGKIHVFANSKSLSTFADKNILQHEIGHHCRYVEDSVLKKTNNLEDLGSKKLEILGYRTNLAHKNIFGADGPEYLRTPDGAEYASILASEEKWNARYPILSGKGITDLFNREVTKSYGYKDYEADEYVADIFRGLTTGKKYSDEVMLAYDFINGGRVPNLVINGKSYDEYIKSLYDNPELVQKLRDMVTIKHIKRVENDCAILENVSKDIDKLMRN